jgi:hypothetical protein
LNAF